MRVVEPARHAGPPSQGRAWATVNSARKVLRQAEAWPPDQLPLAGGLLASSCRARREIACSVSRRMSPLNGRMNIQTARAHRHEAASLTPYRQDRLLSGCPDEVRSAVATLNDDVVELARDMTKRRHGHVTQDNQQWVDMAIRVAPYGLARPYLGRPVPHHVDDATAATADAILHLGDPARR